MKASAILPPFGFFCAIIALLLQMGPAWARELWVVDPQGLKGPENALLASIQGVLYKDYAPYNRGRGAVYWHQGKPSVSYRYLLWEQKDRSGGLRPDWLPAGVAEAVERQASGAEAGSEAYALINVHAWSFRDSGGPMGAIGRTIEALPPRVRVVTATEFFELIAGEAPLRNGKKGD